MSAARWSAALALALLPAGAWPQPPAAAPQGWPPVDELLLRRQALCAEPLARRRQLAEQRRGDPRQAMRLELLMLATCTPPDQATPLPEALARVEQLVGWPASYRALFALLADRARAQTELERRNRRLQTELDRTIRGISDIETGIDARDEKSGKERRNEAE